MKAGRWIFLSMVSFSGVFAHAIPMKSQMLKPRAYYQEADNNLLEALDLKAKVLYFGRKEFDQCAENLVRRGQTLTFSCTLSIPNRAKISRLQNLVTSKIQEVNFGGSKRQVHINVSEDARKITFTTAFDATGFDFEVIKFNDDFPSIYGKAAQLIISDAIKKQPIRLEVLESRT